jgi:predicted RNA-binding protein (virulence factor B family)
MRALPIALILVAACNTSHKELLKAPEEQAALRTMQTRAYDTTDDQKTLRAVIATLQDLGFVIDDGNALLGIVSATKFESPRYGGRAVRIQVAVKRHGEKQTSVRASAQAGNQTITDPEAYQEFFVSLSKGMFLSAHEIE